VPQRVVKIPADQAAFTQLDHALARDSHELAAMIIEPLVQGAGGMRFHTTETVRALAGLAKKHGMLFIADEIATGFYRSGKAFACEEAAIGPDILCLGKALTGGTAGMGATLVREEIFASFLSDDWETALMHGPTFMANPLACAAANASLDLFDREPREKQVEAIERSLRFGLEPCRGRPHVVDVRVKGAIGVVQLDDTVDVYALRSRFVDQGTWIRPFKDIVYLAPPLVIGEDDLSSLMRAVCTVVGGL
jgi:adenosylmethionine-8-amino-7-oxononanoate aminotransferase